MAKCRSQRIGFVFQVHNLIPNISLIENVELPTIGVSGISRVLRRERALNLLTEVGLKNKTGYLPTQVSGGERQRAAIARALVNSPQILLADEPTGNVDSETAEFIMSLILERCRNKNMTTLIVSHNKDITNQAHRTIYMKDGCLIE